MPEWIKVPLSNEDVISAEREAAIRDQLAIENGADPRGAQEGTDEAHRLGVLSEDAVALYRGVPKVRDRWQDDRARGHDVDGFSVRSATKSWYRLPLYKHERSGKWILALMHDLPAVWLAGWITAEEFWRCGPSRYQRDGQPCWMLGQSQLWQLPAMNGYKTEERWLIDPQTPFWCECCGGMHPIIEHRVCRAASGEG